jgi:hypothetical protein
VPVITPQERFQALSRPLPGCLSFAGMIMYAHIPGLSDPALEYIDSSHERMMAMLDCPEQAPETFHVSRETLESEDGHSVALGVCLAWDIGETLESVRNNQSNSNEWQEIRRRCKLAEIMIKGAIYDRSTAYHGVDRLREGSREYSPKVAAMCAFMAIPCLMRSVREISSYKQLINDLNLPSLRR